MSFLQSGSELFSLVDIRACNPWWQSDDDLPTPTDPRADFRYRVKNTLDNQLLFIPGPPGTGKTETLQEIIRALILGPEYENQDAVSAVTDLPADIDPDQVCYIPCDDPLARLVDEFVASAVQLFLAERSGGEFFIFLDGVHRLPEWRTQVDTVVNGLAENFPDDDWHVVTTVPSQDLVETADFGTEMDHTDGIELDLPHHVQKFRASVLDTPALAGAREQIYTTDTEHFETDEHAIDAARRSFRELAVGEGDSSALEAALQYIRDAVLDAVDMDTVTDRIDQYLLTGGFEPATSGLDSDAGPYTDHDSPAVEQVHEHVVKSLEATVYREIPQLVKVEADRKRIEEPRDLNAVATYLARRGYGETSYKELAGTVDRDSRTVKHKYINLLADFHIIEKATRYELQRERSLRFYFRSPGYVSALVRSDPLETHRDVLIRTAIADHLYRQLKGLGGATVPLEYWRTDSAMIDFVFQTEAETAIPFVSTFTNTTGGTPEAFAAFRADQETAPLEVEIAGLEADVAMTGGGSDGVSRLRVPYWVLLLIC